jgi:uridylate kinase
MPQSHLLTPAQRIASSRRILIKISGEAFSGGGKAPLCWDFLGSLARQLAVLSTLKELALVVGGGNFFRGETARGHLSSAVGDQVGMLATFMNARILQDLLQQAGCEVKLFATPTLEGLSHPFVQADVSGYFAPGRIGLFAGGTGQPFFTTDTAAIVWAMRAGCEIVFKATQVDGVYTHDPRKNADAVFCPQLSYQEVLTQKLRVMDLTALTLAAEHALPLVVFNMHRTGALEGVVRGDPPFTWIT